MKQFALSLALATSLITAGPVDAASCFAEYKAKQDNPLRLKHGFAQFQGKCTRSAARRALKSQLEKEGWILLKVVSVSDIQSTKQGD